MSESGLRPGQLFITYNSKRGALTEMLAPLTSLLPRLRTIVRGRDVKSITDDGEQFRTRDRGQIRSLPSPQSHGEKESNDKARCSNRDHGQEECWTEEDLICISSSC